MEGPLRTWRIAQCCSMLLAIIFVLVSCGGKSTSPSTTTSALPAPSPAPSPTPGTTTSSTVIDRIEESPWLTCGNCGNNGATGPTAPYSDTLGIATPSEDGSSTQFSIAASVPYTNGYFYQSHTPVTTQF